MKIYSMNCMGHQLFILLFLPLAFGNLHAQEMVSAGGQASGTNGSFAFSVGQVFSLKGTGAGGSVSSGGLQPYDIYEIVGTENKWSELKLSVYPNPVNDYLILTTEETDLSNLSIQLFDMQGRLLDSYTFKDNHTQIGMKDYTAQSYFLKVTDQNHTIKTFKIIKK